MTAARNIRAVAWDVDGTLVDSEPLHSAALTAVCTDHAVDLGLQAADAFTGVSITGVWHVIGTRFGDALGTANAEREARFYAAIHHHYAAMAPLLRAQPGAREVVLWLASRGIAQCAVSNSHAAIVYTNLRVLCAGEVFRFQLALDDLHAPKPAPDPYLQACSRLGLDPAQVLAVEDSETGVRSAVSAGLPTILLTPLAGSLGNVPAWHALATHRLASLDALPGWMQGEAFPSCFSSGGLS